MLVLASNSPRRKELLKITGVDFTSRSPEVDERVAVGEHPEAYTRRMARTKARAIAAQNGTGWTDGDLILAADTAVIDGGPGGSVHNRGHSTILGKPADAVQAERMLLQLKGHTHQVCTATVVLDPLRDSINEAVVISTVYMRDYLPAEVSAYISSGDPFDKAGGYGIQHPTFQPVEMVAGCYPNVMGLPVCQVVRLMTEMGHTPASMDISDCRMSEHPCRIYRTAIQEAVNG